jgi:hypothetical protein
LYANCSTLVNLYPGYPRVGAELDAVVSHVPLKGFNYIAGIIRGREDPATTLSLGFHTVAPQKGEQIIAKEAVESAIEKTAIGAVHSDKVIELFGVGQVAACLATDEYFVTGVPGLFQQEDAGSQLAGSAGRHHAACSGTDDDDTLSGHGLPL